MIKKKLICIFFLLNVFNAFLFSQTTDKEVHFSLGTVYNFNENEFHEFWDPSMGVEFEFSFDHQFGELGAGLTLMRFEKTASSTLSFYGINYYFLFAKNFTIAKNVSLILGFDFGLYEFRFDEYNDSEIPDVDVEREFAVKLVAGIGYRFAGSWSLEFKTAFNHVYTKKGIDLFNLHLDVTKSFPMSDWLAEILE
jgi:hypothetical protein